MTRQNFCLSQKCLFSSPQNMVIVGHLYTHHTSPTTKQHQEARYKLAVKTISLRIKLIPSSILSQRIWTPITWDALRTSRQSSSKRWIHRTMFPMFWKQKEYDQLVPDIYRGYMQIVDLYTVCRLFFRRSTVRYNLWQNGIQWANSVE